VKALKTTAILSLLFLVAGCVTFHSNTEFRRGRMASPSGRPLEAIPHLEQASAINGELKYSQLQEGPWTYLGRDYYEAKKYPQARQALRARLRPIRTIALPGFTWGLR
jgi:tetratricopeptide (TPR) repeat protein